MNKITFYNDLNRNDMDIYHVPQNGIGLDINIKCKKGHYST
ncbi:hypothetical protein [Clostridium haemolyticum]|nr:hypothetical protein [Clostridium haemolyticum]